MDEEQITLTLTPEDMEGDFLNITDCPIFRALSRRGYEVSNVGGYSVVFGELYRYHIKNPYEVNSRIKDKEENIQVTLIKM